MRNENGNCILGLILVVVLLGWMLVSCVNSLDSGNSCEDLQSWYADNPGDSNPHIERDYQYKC